MNMMDETGGGMSLVRVRDEGRRQNNHVTHSVLHPRTH